MHTNPLKNKLSCTSLCTRGCTIISSVLLSYFLLFAIPLTVSGAETAAGGDGGAQTPAVVTTAHENLRKGKELFDKGRYVEAVEKFDAAYGEVPVMRDYTLYFRAKALNRTGRFDDSSLSLNELLSQHPDTPVKKKARALQIHNVLTTEENGPLSRKLSSRNGEVPALIPSGDAALSYLESYLHDYPEDAEMAYSTALFLKQLGRTEESTKILLRLYSETSPYAEAAGKHLKESDATVDILLTKASNLMKVSEYKKAEQLLRKALAAAPSSVKGDAYKKLGLALFRQKRYREAAEAYTKAGDIYNRARSSYRAGNFDTFSTLLSRLIAMEDKRAGSLLLAYASKKRREGKTDEALSIFSRVQSGYPSHIEEAQWGKAWTYLRSGECEAAAQILQDLVRTYPDARYSYWRNRCGPESDSGVAETDKQPASRGLKKDFYTFLMSLKQYAPDMGNLDHRAERPRPVAYQPFQPKKTVPAPLLPYMERYTILDALGMRDDAITELVRASNGTSDPEVLLSLCRLLQNAGAYRKSLALASRFSEAKASRALFRDADINGVLYPMAYWSFVGEAAETYGIDPLLLLSVIREESRYDPNARSIAGALGLMQIMPQTAQQLTGKLTISFSGAEELYNIKTNITIGAYYLKSLMTEFGSLPVAVAAYNAGSERVAEWIRDGKYRSMDEFIEDIPYDETRNYVKKVLTSYFIYRDMQMLQQDSLEHGKDAF